jgi:hypothetical protein
MGIQCGGVQIFFFATRDETFSLFVWLMAGVSLF